MDTNLTNRKEDYQQDFEELISMLLKTHNNI